MNDEDENDAVLGDDGPLLTHRNFHYFPVIINN